MKKHFGITCLAYFLFGAADTIQTFRVKLGFDFMRCYFLIYIPIMVFFIIVVFTSMQKVKDAIKFYDENKPKTNQ